MRVAVVGACGRMGIETCRALVAADDLELVAAVAPRAAGRDLAELVGIGTDLVVAGDLTALADAGAEVLVDFSVPLAAVAALEYAVATGIHAVSGTTGIEAAALARLAQLFDAPSGPNAVYASNFSISAAVLMRLAALAAPHFAMAEIVELHHERKADAPSGTALETARHLAAARETAGVGPFGEAAPTVEVLAGARGGAGPGGVRIHAVRLAGLLAHEEVLFGAPGQTLTLRQDTLERSAYMPGVLLALRRVADTPGFTLGLAPLLGI
jgi:4-hydroxy-tetrahydrodipicolinate reductase